MERDDTISNENDGKVVSQRTGTGTEEQNACLNTFGISILRCLVIKISFLKYGSRR